MTNTNSISEAYDHCRVIAQNHYENFPVASFLIPAKLRKHVYAVYAFARHADDLSDEKHDREGLVQWKIRLHESVNGSAQHPIFIALSDTIHQFDLPLELFDRLLAAFEQDLDKNRFKDFDELFAYCENSANPVGRIVLLLNGYRKEELFGYSDHICTALQLTNFWQDVRIDIQKNRIYLPQDYMEKHHVTEEQIRNGIFDDRFRRLMISLVEEARQLFGKGMPIVENVAGRLRWELKFTIMGGLTILDRIAKINYNVLQNRPALNKLHWAGIAFNILSYRKLRFTPGKAPELNLERNRNAIL